MILGYHLIIGAYGFWLPNDERGSWSDFVRNYELYTRGGAATKVETRRSVAARPHDRQRRQMLRESLKYPPVKFNGLQARCVAQGFANVANRSSYKVYACAVMPDHAHLVLGRHHYKVEQMSNLLKGAATTCLVNKGVHPLGDCIDDNGRMPTPWAQGQWKVFLDKPDEIHRAIKYVEDNPTKAGLKRQRWGFVIPYVGDE
ncbi:MAG: hypothetical protein GC159_15450 [Phycisphaera sp.]|nr:hypothetical protein [Phycisphaera sp.]